MMRRLLMLVVVALVMAAMMAASALPLLADPAPPVGPHQHYLTTGNGETVRVGPNVCANPEAQQGFNNFHHNVHVNPDHPTTVTATGCPPPS